MSPRVSFFLLAIFILSMHAPTDYSPVSNAQANSNCDNGEFKPTEWNESVERLAKIPNVFDMDNDYSDDDRGRRGDRDRDGDDERIVTTDYDGPEETWMTWEPGNDLNLLRNDFSTQLDIGNDAVGTLRVNLDYERRTTVCVTIDSLNQTIKPSADVYLMTDTQYDRYTAAYDVAHGAWSWDNDDDDPTNEVSPEWRSFTVVGWHSFRDVHQYEEITEVSFSVSLDGPEVSSGLFGESSVQYFNIVIDNTNNSHTNDAVPETEIRAFVQVVTEERGTVLPNWTVSVVCCGVMIATVFIPVVMNKRYMNSGLTMVTLEQQNKSAMVPTLEKK